MNAASASSSVDAGLDRRRHRDLGRARVVAVVDLDRDAEAGLGQRGAIDAFGADLAEHALAESVR